MISQDELEDIYQFAIELGKSAGKILLEGIERRRVDVDNDAHEAVEKLNAVDIVTQTDNGMSASRPVGQAAKTHSIQMSKNSSMLLSKADTRNTPSLAKRRIRRVHRSNT